MHQIYIITEQIVKKINKRLKIIVNVRVSSSINTASQLKKNLESLLDKAWQYHETLMMSRFHP